MELSYLFYYILISLFCTACFIENYFNMKRYGHHTLSARYLRWCVVDMIIHSAAEVIYGLREMGFLGQSIVLAYAEEIIYALAALLAGCLWFISSELYQQSPLTSTQKRRLLVSLPALIMALVNLLTPLHHLTFSFENGHYVRGVLLIPFALIEMVLIVITGARALVNSFRKQFYLERGYFRVIALYGFILLLSQTVQLIVGPIMPFRTMGAALVMYIVQQKYIKENVNVDNLTGANNRNALEKYLARLMVNPNTKFQLAMIDADYFKKINDTYGHQAGDRALQLLAASFMKHLTPGCFFARFGGDEFVLVHTSGHPDTLHQIAENARQLLKEQCLQSGTGYQVDFSYGVIERTAEMKAIPDVLSAADAEMYRIKKDKKAAR